MRPDRHEQGAMDEKRLNALVRDTGFDDVGLAFWAAWAPVVLVSTRRDESVLGLASFLLGIAVTEGLIAAKRRYTDRRVGRFQPTVAWRRRERVAWLAVAISWVAAVAGVFWYSSLVGAPADYLGVATVVSSCLVFVTVFGLAAVRLGVRRFWIYGILWGLFFGLLFASPSVGAWAAYASAAVMLCVGASRLRRFSRLHPEPRMQGTPSGSSQDMSKALRGDPASQGGYQAAMMRALSTVTAGDSVFLITQSGVPPGELDAAISALEQAGYVECGPARSHASALYSLTPAGRLAVGRPAATK